MLDLQKSILKDKIIISISVIFQAISVFIINKQLALYFGQKGIVEYAQFQNFISIFSIIVTTGTAQGLLTLLSGKNISNYVLKLTFIIHFVILILFSTSLFIFKSYIGQFSYLEIIFLCIFFSSFLFNQVIQSILISQNKKNINAFCIILVSLIGVIFTYLSIYNHIKLSTLLISIWSSQLILSLVLVIYLKYRYQLKIIADNFDSNLSKKVFIKFITLAISIAIFGKLTDFLVRSFAINNFEIIEVGNWQSLIRLSDGYVSILGSIFYYLFFAAIASFGIIDNNKIKQFLFQKIGFIAIILMLGFISLYFIKGFIIQLLYSSQFSIPDIQCLLQFSTDFLRLCMWLPVFYLTIYHSFKINIFLEFVSCFVYLMFLVIFKSETNILELLLSNLYRYIIYSILVVYLVFFHPKYRCS